MVIKAITTDSFRDDVLKTRKPVHVKFWAPCVVLPRTRSGVGVN